MREKLFNWLGHEFIALSCEGDAVGSVTDETARLFADFDARLRAHGLAPGLAHTVRTRLWARDMDCWDGGVKERARILSGDPNHPDHWRDIEGQARLASEQLP